MSGEFLVINGGATLFPSRLKGHCKRWVSKVGRVRTEGETFSETMSPGLVRTHSSFAYLHKIESDDIPAKVWQGCIVLPLAAQPMAGYGPLMAAREGRVGFLYECGKDFKFKSYSFIVASKTEST